jgi:O-antigen/teichoic acid export membrane protein
VVVLLDFIQQFFCKGHTRSLWQYSRLHKNFYKSLKYLAALPRGFFIFLYSFPAIYEFYNAKTKLISIGAICAAIINIVCDLIFIPLYAGTGAAIATLISFAFLFIFHEIIARFVIQNYDYKFTIYLKGLVPVVAVSAIFYVMQDFWYIRWGLGAVLGIYLLRRIIKNRAMF